jgi:DUF177 domain-containing protein
VIDGADSADGIKPLVIDPTRFARDRSRVVGELLLSRLPRLDGLLFDREGAVSYAVEGYTSAKGLPALRIDLTADLAVRCQRCLERLPLRLNLRREIVLVAGKLDSADDEDDDIDVIESASSLDMHDLLEQEVVLSLPMAPRHQAGACSLQLAPVKTDETSSPFSALTGTKTGPD